MEKYRNNKKGTTIFVSDNQLLFMTIMCIILIIVFNYNALSALNRMSEMDLWIQVLINVGSALLTSLIFTAIMYFKFLKNIPKEMETLVVDNNSLRIDIDSLKNENIQLREKVQTLENTLQQSKNINQEMEF